MSPARGKKRRSKTLVEALLPFEDVVRVRRTAGEVLIYCGHIPLGLYLVIGGTIRCEPAGRGDPDLWAADKGPMLIPAVGELDQPASGQLSFETDGELLFIPRSLLQSSRRVRQLLRLTSVETRGRSALPA